MIIENELGVKEAVKKSFIFELQEITSLVFTNGPEDLCSIPGRVIPKTQKMVLDATSLNTQHYKGTDQG